MPSTSAWTAFARRAGLVHRRAFPTRPAIAVPPPGDVMPSSSRSSKRKPLGVNRGGRHARPQQGPVTGDYPRACRGPTSFVHNKCCAAKPIWVRGFHVAPRDASPSDCCSRPAGCRSELSVMPPGRLWHRSWAPPGETPRRSGTGLAPRPTSLSLAMLEPWVGHPLVAD